MVIESKSTLFRSVLDYWVDISELKEEDKVSRVLTGLQIALSLQIETTDWDKREKQGQERITLITLFFHLINIQKRFSAITHSGHLSLRNYSVTVAWFQLMLKRKMSYYIIIYYLPLLFFLTISQWYFPYYFPFLFPACYFPNNFSLLFPLSISPCCFSILFLLAFPLTISPCYFPQKIFFTISLTISPCFFPFYFSLLFPLLFPLALFPYYFPLLFFLAIFSHNFSLLFLLLFPLAVFLTISPCCFPSYFSLGNYSVCSWSGRCHTTTPPIPLYHVVLQISQHFFRLSF